MISGLVFNGFAYATDYIYKDGYENEDDLHLLKDTILNETEECIMLNATTGIEEWLSGWNYRKSHIITGSEDGEFINYQIGIIVYKGEGEDGTIVKGSTTFGLVYCESHCQDSFGDIRFTKSDGITQLDYWIEYISNGDYIIFWVEVDLIEESPSTTKIYIYYGTEEETTTSHSMSNTWDDSLNWTTDLTGSFTKYQDGVGPFTSDYLTPTDGEYPCRILYIWNIRDWHAGKYSTAISVAITKNADDTRDADDWVKEDIIEDTDYGADADTLTQRLGENDGGIKVYDGDNWDFELAPFSYITEICVVADSLSRSETFTDGLGTVISQQSIDDAPDSMNYWGYENAFGGTIGIDVFSYDGVNDWIEWGGKRNVPDYGEVYRQSKWMVIGKFTMNEPTHTSFGVEEDNESGYFDNGYAYSKEIFTGNKTVDHAVINSTIPENCGAIFSYSPDNSTWTDHVLTGNNELIEIYDIFDGFYYKFNLSSTGASSPKVFNNTIVYFDDEIPAEGFNYWIPIAIAAFIFGSLLLFDSISKK